MPFDEENEQEPVLRKTLKKANSTKSIFDDMPKKPSQEQFENQVKQMQNTMQGYKRLAAEYNAQFKSIIADKTLSQNKNPFQKSFEADVLSNMIKLSEQINVDPNESEGMGSLLWITLLLKVVLFQRDQINQLEYTVSQLNK
jgi:hypothetical protein